MGQTLLLTGRPGIGKTTIIQEVADGLSDRVGGFYTEEIRGSDGRRKGFRLVTLEGQEAVMAHVDLRGKGHPRVSRYGVDVEAIERVGVPALQKAMMTGSVIVVDEIGKMELFSDTFREAVLQSVKGPTPMVATVMSGTNPWVDTLKAMPQVEVWKVTRKNRDELAARIVQWLDEEPSA